jgi:hypothetical protein
MCIVVCGCSEIVNAMNAVISVAVQLANMLPTVAIKFAKKFATIATIATVAAIYVGNSANWRKMYVNVCVAC